MVAVLDIKYPFYHRRRCKLSMFRQCATLINRASTLFDVFHPWTNAESFECICPHNVETLQADLCSFEGRQHGRNDLSELSFPKFMFLGIPLRADARFHQKVRWKRPPKWPHQQLSPSTLEPGAATILGGDPSNESAYLGHRSSIQFQYGKSLWLTLSLVFSLKGSQLCHD